jgi:uncharacterized membrane protein YbhN (UPF0104 family)
MRRWLPWIVSASLSVGLMWYLLSQIDPREIGRALRGIDHRALVGFAIATIVGVAARTTRFWVLLQRRVRWTFLAGVTLARGLFIDLLPARLGELSYVYLLTTRAGRPVEEGVSTLVLSVLFDLVALGPLVVLAVIVVGSGEVLPVGWLVALSVAMVALAYVAIRLAEPITRWMADRMGRGRPEGRLHNLAAKLRLTSTALGQIHGRGVFASVLGISTVVRLAKFASYYFLFLAVMAPYGYTTASVGFFRVFLGVVGAELSAALPVHGIAGFGTYESVWAFTFTRLGFDREHAIISGILAHLLSQLVEYAMGAAALLWLMRPSRGAPAASTI